MPSPSFQTANHRSNEKWLHIPVPPLRKRRGGQGVRLIYGFTRRRRAPKMMPTRPIAATPSIARLPGVALPPARSSKRPVPAKAVGVFVGVTGGVAVNAPPQFSTHGVGVPPPAATVSAKLALAVAVSESLLSWACAVNVDATSTVSVGTSVGVSVGSGVGVEVGVSVGVSVEVGVAVQDFAVAVAAIAVPTKSLVTAIAVRVPLNATSIVFWFKTNRTIPTRPNKKIITSATATIKNVVLRGGRSGGTSGGNKFESSSGNEGSSRST